MAYRIDIQHPTAVLVACTFVPSAAAPGKTLCVNENGNTLVVLPDGTERPDDEPPGANWDSAWTWADVLDGVLVYRSDGAGWNPTLVPRGYKMVGA